MKSIWILGKNSFKQYVRDRFVLSVFFVGIFIIFLSLFLSELNIEETQRILVHLSLSAIQISLLGMSVFLGGSVIHQEVERQTCLMVLARPMERGRFITGKWLGIILIILVMASLGLLLLYALVMSSIQLSAEIRWMRTLNFLQISLSLLFESFVLVSMSLFFGLLFRPLVAVFASITVYLAGNWHTDLSFFAEKSKNPYFLWASNIFERIIPQFERFNFRSYMYLEKGLANMELIWCLLHSIGWSLLFLFLAQFVFRRKDLV